MSSQLATLHEQILTLQDELEIAERAHIQASSALASAPNDPDAFATARRAATRAADLRGDIKVLRDAKGHAEIEARSEKALARKRAAADALALSKKLAAKRIKAGEAIDAALVALKNAAQDWVAVNGEMGDAVIQFYRDAMPNNPRRNEHLFGVSADLVNIASNAIACQVEEAVRGINVHGSFAFNFQRASPLAPERVAADAKRWGDKLLSRMDGVANAEGLPA